MSYVQKRIRELEERLADTERKLAELKKAYTLSTEQESPHATGPYTPWPRKTDWGNDRDNEL